MHCVYIQITRGYNNTQYHKEKKLVLSGMEKRNSGNFEYRNIDLVLKEKLQNGDADFFICERHFTSDDIEYTAKYFLVFFLDICFTGT